MKTYAKTDRAFTPLGIVPIVVLVILVLSGCGVNRIELKKIEEGEERSDPSGGTATAANEQGERELKKDERGRWILDRNFIRDVVTLACCRTGSEKKRISTRTGVCWMSCAILRNSSAGWVAMPFCRPKRSDFSRRRSGAPSSCHGTTPGNTSSGQRSTAWTFTCISMKNASGGTALRSKTAGSCM